MATPGAVPEAVQVRRTFAAPREKVFEAWINPKMMTRWFARGANTPEARIVEADARVGGKYRVEVSCLPEARPDEASKGPKDPQGMRVYKIFGTYREMKPPERLAFTWTWEGADFETSLVSVDFRALGQSNFTEVVLNHSQLPEKEREEHRKGWEGCFDMLEKAL